TLMRRIAVIGTTGSGKTTLARQLAQRLGAPFVEEDALAWGPNWTMAPRDVLRQRIADALSGTAWVVDGNMFSLGHPNLQMADTVVWLDLPLSVILWRLVWRSVRRIARREELWRGNRERWRTAFFSRESLLWYALRTFRARRRAYTALFAQAEYAHLRVVRLRSERAARAWLCGIAEPALRRGSW
ncbi:MAG TPA: AAA family ATPase, partial [bacterium]|nr:AAA family ATPase [bacterium]